MSSELDKARAEAEAYKILLKRFSELFEDEHQINSEWSAANAVMHKNRDGLAAALREIEEHTDSLVLRRIASAALARYAPEAGAK